MCTFGLLCHFDGKENDYSTYYNEKEQTNLIGHILHISGRAKGNVVGRI
jgi:hypothetical protein